MDWANDILGLSAYLKRAEWLDRVKKDIPIDEVILHKSLMVAPSNAAGFYNINHDFIIILPITYEQGIYPSVLLHELAHSTMPEHRANRKMGNEDEENVANLTTILLSEQLSLDVSGIIHNNVEKISKDTEDRLRNDVYAAYNYCLINIPIKKYLIYRPEIIWDLPK